jgi:hypothetical protein
MRDEGLSTREARNRVIIEWLLAGDSRALAALLLDGHVLGETARVVLALMLLDETDAKATIEQRHLDPETWRFPYRFMLKGGRAAGRRFSPENAERDRLLAENVNRLRQQGVRYKVAIDTVNRAVRDSGGAIGEQTIRDAYDRRHGKKPRN